MNEKKKKTPKAPPSRSEEFKKYKKKMGMANNVEMRHLMKKHPMNTEGIDYKSQGGKMGSEAVYAKIGCKVYNNR
jgi:hypothetical protein